MTQQLETPRTRRGLPDGSRQQIAQHAHLTEGMWWTSTHRGVIGSGCAAMAHGATRWAAAPEQYGRVELSTTARVVVRSLTTMPRR